MEHVNNDMDELFRKAGELYPLKTTESDWDGVLGKLRDEISGETGTPFAVPVRGNSNRRRWFLLLLVPAFIVSLVYFAGPGTKENKAQSLSKTSDLPASKNSTDANKIPVTPGKTNMAIIPKTETQLKPAGSITAIVPVVPGDTKSAVQAGQTPNQKMSSGSNTNTNSNIQLFGTVPKGEAGGQSAYAQTKNVIDPESFHEPVKKAVPLSVYGLNENPSVYGMPFPPLVLKDVTLNSATAATVAKTNKAVSSKGIYAVLLGGPDWSTVALQSTEQAGYSLGMLVGYRFNKRLSIETGLLWDKKNYYSDGGYFDKSKIHSIAPAESLLSVDGYCNMYEIPLNLRFDFAQRVNHGFFVTGGLSTYLMKKEYYSYLADSSGYNPWYGQATYKNSSNYFFSILQISGGYEYSIGKNTKIRVEPYVKIPLQGIGVGNMPISSFGLYFGISHSFH